MGNRETSRKDHGSGEKGLMKAMVLAAGLGTRLRPLTEKCPKALIEVGGRTLLEITLSRLRSVGIRDVIINIHHRAEMVVDYLNAKADFGMGIEISHEEELLETGGGLKKAGWFFSDSAEPFILHNVDVLTNIDLLEIIRFHVEHGALATLAVNSRKTSRPLLFDETGELRGRGKESGPRDHAAGWDRTLREFGFCGIHVISPKLLSMLLEDGAFSIVESYLRLAAAGERVLAFPADRYYWRDLGRLESLRQAEQDIHEKLVL
jgi:NDP-sugar pyrophosphorylase family protein